MLDADDFIEENFEPTKDAPPTKMRRKAVTQKKLPTAALLPAPLLISRNYTLEDYRRDLKKSRANVREDEEDEDSESESSSSDSDSESDDSAPGYDIEAYANKLKLKAVKAEKKAEEAKNEANEAKKLVFNERRDARKSQGMTTERNITSINTARDQIKKAQKATKKAEEIMKLAKEYVNHLDNLNEQVANNSEAYLDRQFDKHLAPHITASKTKKKPIFFSDVKNRVKNRVKNMFLNMFTKRNSNTKVKGKGSQKKRRKNKHKK